MKYFIVISFIFIAAISNAQQKYRITAERNYRYDTSVQEFVLYDLVTYGYKPDSKRGLNAERDTVYYDTMRHYTLSGDTLKLKDREDVIYGNDNKVDTAYSGIQDNEPYRPSWMKVFRYDEQGLLTANGLFANMDIKDSTVTGVYGDSACRYGLIQKDSFEYLHGKPAKAYKYCLRPNCVYYLGLDHVKEGDSLLLMETVVYTYDGDNAIQRIKMETIGGKPVYTKRRMWYNDNDKLLTYSTYTMTDQPEKLDTLYRIHKYGRPRGDELIERVGDRIKWMQTQHIYNSAGQIIKTQWEVEMHRVGSAPSKDTSQHIVRYSYNSSGKKVKEQYYKYDNKHDKESLQETFVRTYIYTRNGYLRQEESEYTHYSHHGKKVTKYKATYEYERY